MNNRRLQFLRRGRCLALLAGLSTAGCEAEGGVILSVDATGFLAGQAYIDENANGLFDDGEPRVRRVPVVLRLWGPDNIVAITSSDGSAIFRIPQVPVGTYRLAIGDEALGDTLRLGDGLFNEFTVDAGQSLEVDIGLRPR